MPSFNWHLLPGGVSNVLWHAVSPSNSLVLTWQNSAELLYAIDCGAQVPFSLSDGELGTVNVSCAASLSNSQTITPSNFQTSSFPHEWSVGDMALHLDAPRAGWIRRIAEVCVDDQGREVISWLPLRNNNVKSDYFDSWPYDWGDETGRGFYGRGDTLATTIDRLLMHGHERGWTGDIPDRRVRGLSKKAKDGYQKVGAAEIEKNDRKVFTR